MSNPLVPPAPKVHGKDLPIWRFIPSAIHSSLSVWPEYAFDIRFNRAKLVGKSTALVNDPDGIRHFLVANAANYRRPVAVRRIGRPLGGSGLFLADGADWRRQRRLLAPTFNPGSIAVLVPHFQAAAVHLLRAIEGRSAANLSTSLQDTALEAVLRALFSMPENGARDELSGLARTYVAGPGRPDIFDVFARQEDDFAFAGRGRRRFQRNWFAAIDRIVAERKAQPPSPHHRDLLDALLALKDADTGETLSDAEIRDQCATMFFAGSETTARLMFWAAYLLALDGEEQSRVRHELAAFPPERVGRLDDLQQWPRLRNVLLEALRLYPPLPHIMRVAIEADEICGEHIEPGTEVWASAWVMHRHRKFWQHPTAFVPDRFAGKAAPWIQMPAYIPFGAGPRICIGLHFALSEAQIVLAHLLARRRIGLTRPRPVMPIGRVTIEPSHEPMFRLESVG